ncbi:MAG: hypothetical protein GOMPHAMPRED_004743 [Gomphillus americanus]|uniref:Alpha-type protein kinase domain-containing protein n=1 Tax=Gomphillus americanus TaxID=1940652 RepID=A0A8H3EIQ3_9LECA|nr:MAG: hypothetical protein GOMPHAMPRED_004743 [Gomphillus americanus]
MDPPPPYQVEVSMTRTRNQHDNIQEMAETLLRSSVSQPGLASSDVSPLAEESTAPSSTPLPKQEIPPEVTLPVVSPTVKVTGPPVTPVPPDSPNLRRLSLISSPYLPIMGTARPQKTKVPSNSIEKLRSIEQENEELRRQAQRDQAQIEQLKRDANRSAYVSNKEAKLRIAQLKNEARAAVAEIKTSPTSTLSPSLFKSTCSSDLLFLIDCTSSMRNSIVAVKENVKKIVTDISAAFYDESKIRVAVVAYRDHTDNPNIQALDFTTSTEQVFLFLTGLEATGGGDIPEDVLGGVNRALNMSWEQPTRCLVHIADAPPHGRVFQDPPFDADRYPEAGREPHGLLYEPLFQLMTRMSINYLFLPIAKKTDRMAFLFSQVYLAASADVQLNAKNRYCDSLKKLVVEQSRSQTVASSKRTVQGNLMFAVAEMGTVYTYLQKLVVKSVIGSATRTASRTVTQASQSMGGDTKVRSDVVSSKLKAIDEGEFDIEKPSWNTSAWFDEVIVMEGFSPEAVVHSARTLDDMIEDDEKMKMSTTDLTIYKRAKPFAQGATRLAFYGRTTHSTSPFVVKSFKREGKQLVHLVEEMRGQTFCKAFALEFNSLVAKEYAIDFIVTTSLKGKSEKTGSNERLSLEPFIQGDYVKYNNNCGYVNEDIAGNMTNQAAQAFSHFTFERSHGQFLISDLQGVGNILTDPAVHAREPERYRLSDTNLGTDGFKFFFATHECNAVCKVLQLKSKASMLLKDNYEFRETWPSVESTVCCSNKLCGKIVRLKSAHKALIYPGFYWCEACFPQIERTRLRQACIGAGPYHTFEVSAFFFESQGRMTPRTCPSHRTRDEAVRPPSMPDEKGGGGFLKKFGFSCRDKKAK